MFANNSVTDYLLDRYTYQYTGGNRTRALPFLVSAGFPTFRKSSEADEFSVPNRLMRRTTRYLVHGFYLARGQAPVLMCSADEARGFAEITNPQLENPQLQFSRRGKTKPLSESHIYANSSMLKTSRSESRLWRRDVKRANSLRPI